MIYNIHALRGVAAIMVVLVHCGALIFSELPMVMSAFGKGVQIFFVISGFVMVHSTREDRNPFNFMRKRLIRIVPLYWGMTLLTCAGAMLAPKMFASTEVTAEYITKSLLFIPYVKASGLVQPILFVGWTLNLEMMFYIIFAVSLFWGRIAPVITIGAIVLIAALHPFASDLVSQFITNPILLCFVSGMILASVKLPESRAGGIALLGLGVLCLFLPPLAWLGSARWPVDLAAATLIVGGALVTERAGLKVTGRPFLRIGSASYSIYLVHAFIAVPLERKFHLADFGTRLLAISGAVGLSILAGIIVYLVFERPVLRLLKSQR